MRALAIRWSRAKSAELKRTRGVSFEEIVRAELLGVLEHPTRPNQDLLLLLLDGYVWVAPFVTTEDGIFLKTLFPSRKLTRRWRRGEPI